MNCDEAKNNMTIRFFGELDPDERAALEEHLRICPDCARISEVSEGRREGFEFPDKTPLPDWGRSWEIIAGRALDRPRPVRLFGLPRIWITAAASLLVVLFLGYFGGRRLLVSLSGPAFPSGAPAAAGTPSLGRYADSAEAVLIDFLNRGAAGESRDVVAFERKITRSMLAETRLLQSLARPSRDGAMKEFLEEMESLFLSLSNLDPADRDSADLLERTIRGREIRSKLRGLSGANTVI
jgi:hypothetical protein